jgi:hypothetical protein
MVERDLQATLRAFLLAGLELLERAATAVEDLLEHALVHGHYVTFPSARMPPDIKARPV